MKFLEAMEQLSKGKKVTRNGWVKGVYLQLDKNGGVVDECGRPYFISRLTDDYLLYEEEEEDDREEVSQIYKDLYRVINECMKVPMQDDIILHWIEQNDFRYTLDELQVMLNLMNLKYKLDK